jgi:hypothetical protein
VSGSTIGGVVGGVAGGIIGFYSGNAVLGAQIGFSIGSSIGGYVDPVQVKGPRLTDAMSQTSTVGGVIPFGYGRFVTGGNLIWCDRLIEHVKRQRQGKGASSKATTYTYTRSYAVGVCQGEIFGFHWIKRNGKKVYTSDPAATAEEKAYSAKWLGKVTLYRGGESQMPDSTIVAVEGAGNVSPFRGLAYIVVENDDLTDLSGAVPQYEFCVIATPPEAYLTSKPYPQEENTRLGRSFSFGDASIRDLLKDAGDQQESLWPAFGLGNAVLRPPIADVPLTTELLARSITLGSATLRAPVVDLGSATSRAGKTFALGSALIRNAVISTDQSNSPEKIGKSISFGDANLYAP